MLVPMQLEFTLKLPDDRELLQKLDAVDDSKGQSV